MPQENRKKPLKLSLPLSIIEHMFESTTYTPEPPAKKSFSSKDPALEQAEEIEAIAGLEDQFCQQDMLSYHMSAINVGFSTMAKVAAQIDEEGLWSHWGHRSLEHFLSWSLGLDRREATQLALVARSLESFPKAEEAFSKGKLSLAKMAILCRIADQDSEEELLDLALVATISQFERIASSYRGVIRREQELQDSERKHASRSLSYYFDNEGILVIKGRLPEEAGAIFVNCLEEAETDLEYDEDTNDPTAARRADALVAMAVTSLSPPDSHSSPSRPHISILCDASALEGKDGRLQIEGGPTIPVETAQRMWCDATYLGILERDGSILEVGSKTRGISLRTRRALLARDESCVWPGCTNRRYVEAHHIHWRSEGGDHRLVSLALLCWFHHRKLHNGKFEMVRLEGGRFQFFTPDGQLIPNCPDPPESSADIALRLEEQDVVFDPRACCEEQDGGKMDLATIVNTLFRNVEMRRLRREAREAS